MAPRWELPLICFFLSAVVFLESRGRAEDASSASRPIKVYKPKKLPADPIPAKRTPLGVPEDYKPWIVKLNDKQLIVVAFHAGRNPVN